MKSYFHHYFFIFIVLFSSASHSQNIIDDVLSKVEGIVDKHSELLSVFEDIKPIVTLIEGFAKDFQGCSSSEKMFQFFAEVLKIGRDIQQHKTSQTCNQDQLMAAIESLSTESRSRSDALVRKVVELETVLTSILQKEKASCDPPSRALDGLGCITPVDIPATFSEARYICAGMGARLLEGMRTLDQLQIISDNFEDFFTFSNTLHDVYIGIYKRKWIQEGTFVPGFLWKAADRTLAGEHCTLMALQTNPPDILDMECTRELPFLCQAV